MTVEIPTMACDRCQPNPVPDGWMCDKCWNAGCVERPKLTPEQITNLPDGARVVIRGGREIEVTGGTSRLALLLDFHARGVWRLDDA